MSTHTKLGHLFNGSESIIDRLHALVGDEPGNTINISCMRDTDGSLTITLTSRTGEEIMVVSGEGLRAHEEKSQAMLALFGLMYNIPSHVEGTSH